MSRFTGLSRAGALLSGAACLFLWQASQAAGAGRLGAQAALAGNTPSSTSAKVPDPAEAQGIIFERQQTMLQLEKDSDLMGRIVAGLVPADKMAETARAIARGAKDAYEDFKPNLPGGRAKPEIWSNWPDYSQRMESFVRNSDAMSKAAEKGNVSVVISMLGDALPCKQCHDVYRTPRKSTDPAS
jgi:cytochrome c556